MASVREWIARRRATCIEPGEWGPRAGRARVLVEHPDGLQLWAEAETLREAGYDVAVCRGPESDGAERTRCALLAQGRCALAEGADVVVSTPALAQAREILAALAERDATLVVEGPRATLEHGGYPVEGAHVVPFPVTSRGLVEAVDEASGAGPLIA